jgi:adenine-specific DNA-methyltransferase
MKKTDLIDKVKKLEGLNGDEKAYLLNLVNTKKKYGLIWEDKPEYVEEELREKLPILEEIKNRAIVEGENYPNHILIEGDNLHALTTLTFTYDKKIDLIYIDPPYNTGEGDFKYNDTFIDKEDSFRHSKWLSFMHKRLIISKRLLSDEGILICHIDENEFDNLSILLKEIFGENNNLGTIIWNKKNPKGDAKGVAQMHEYIICFARNKNTFLNLKDTLKRVKPNSNTIINKAKKLYKKLDKIEIPEEVATVIEPFNYQDEKLSDFRVEYDLNVINKEFNNWIQRQDFSEGEKAYEFIDQDGKPFQTVSMSWPNKKVAPDDYFVKLLHPINGEECPIPDRGWRNPPSTMKSLLGDNETIELPNGMIIKGEITFTVNKKGENNQPRRKYLLENNLFENTPSIYNYGASDDSFFKNIKIDFPYAKPLEVAKYLIQSIHPNPKIICDFFAGTGPALHATMEINKEQEKEIACIVATNNENNIAEDCYRRNKMIIEGYEISSKKKVQVIDGLGKNNLRYYKCDFVDRKPTITNKRKLTNLATELLCIKEDCYYECTSELNNYSWNKFITNKQGKYSYILYDDQYVEEAVYDLSKFISEQDDNITIKVYVFANGQYPYSEEFEEIADNITLAALPDAIYKAYQSVLPTVAKQIVPVLEEDKQLENEGNNLFNFEGGNEA